MALRVIVWVLFLKFPLIPPFGKGRRGFFQRGNLIGRPVANYGKGKFNLQDQAKPQSTYPGVVRRWGFFFCNHTSIQYPSSIMASPFDPNDFVTLEALTIANMWEVAALL